MKSAIKIEIEDLGELDEWVTAIVHRKVQEQIEKKLDETIETAVSAAANEVIADKLRAQAEAIIADGWTETDGYGRTTRVRTLRDLMTDLLTKPSGDSYSRNREPFATKVIKEALSAAITKNFAADIAAAQKELKGMLDASVKEKLANALKQALGLPTS